MNTYILMCVIILCGIHKPVFSYHFSLISDDQCQPDYRFHNVYNLCGTYKYINWLYYSLMHDNQLKGIGEL